VNGGVEAAELAYDVAPHTRLLLGPKYILLAEAKAPPARAISSIVNRVLITVGGADPRDITSAVTACAIAALPESAVDVVIGPFFGSGADVQIDRLAASHLAVTPHRGIRDLRPLMSACDLCISSGGQTLFELAFTGTPCVAFGYAENQTANLRGLSARGTIEWVGDVTSSDLLPRLTAQLSGLARDPLRRRRMSESGLTIVDGLGAARVADTILGMCA
jgi:spore coat polysaccharide biosynthesis predicted glycosyltransferase SpsG